MKMMMLSLVCMASRERMSDWEWVRSECRAETPGIRKEEDELRLDSWIQIWSTGWKLNKVKQFSAPSLKTSSIPLKNPEGEGGEEAGGVEGQSGARGSGEEAEGKDTKWAEGG